MIFENEVFHGGMMMSRDVILHDNPLKVVLNPLLL